MASNCSSTLLTIGEIARQLSQPIHRIEYILRARDIEPTSRAGNIRVFTEADVSYIAGELRHIDADKEAVQRGSW